MATARRKQTIEYRLLVEPVHDETLKKDGILFHLETTTLFANFSYQIDVKDTIEKATMVWTLHGLQPPSMNMPESGVAQFSKVYFDLPKKITFTLMKKDNVRASVDLVFSKASVTATKAKDTFLKIYTDRQLFETMRPTDRQPPEHKPDIQREQPSQATKRKKH